MNHSHNQALGLELARTLGLKRLSNSFVDDTIPGAVVALQRGLRALGKDIGSYGPGGDGVDGKLGPRTLAELKAYITTSGKSLGEALRDLSAPAQLTPPAVAAVPTRLANLTPTGFEVVSLPPHDQGRYQIQIIPIGEPGAAAFAQMRVIDPSGAVVWQSRIASGQPGSVSGAGGGQPLPGLNVRFPGRLITAEYPIGSFKNWEVPPGGDGNAMCYSDHSAGFYISLENAPNMKELGGKGRGAFGIHPAGRSIYSGGCIKILSQDGTLGPESDRMARSFATLFRSIPESQSPRSIEILNPDEMRSPARTYAFQDAGPNGTPTTNGLPAGIPGAVNRQSPSRLV